MSIPNLADSLMFSFACVLFTCLVMYGVSARLDELSRNEKFERVMLGVVCGVLWLFFAFHVVNLLLVSFDMVRLWRS